MLHIDETTLVSHARMRTVKTTACSIGTKDRKPIRVRRHDQHASLSPVRPNARRERKTRKSLVDERQRLFAIGSWRLLWSRQVNRHGLSVNIGSLFLILLFEHLKKILFFRVGIFQVAAIVACRGKMCYLHSASAQTTLVDIGLKHNMFLTSDFSASPLATPEIDER